MREGQKRDFARGLRRSMTDAERKLWYHLRNRGLFGCKFRRQFPIGRYVVDCVCLDACLVIEVDGGQHAGSADDIRRDGFLHEQGFTVLRFWNNEVLIETDAVLAVVSESLGVVPSPQPSPASGRGGRS